MTRAKLLTKHHRLAAAPLRTRRHAPWTRRANGSAAFYAELGPTPSVPDLAAARAYHVRVLELVERGGWTKIEMMNLKRLEKRWKRRAMGEDGRWLLVGEAGGRLSKEREAATGRTPSPHWTEPGFD
jgi:hypothetical protein